MSREVALLRRARAQGLATLAYVHTNPEARQMAMAGVDIVNIDLGWNTGGALGVATRMPIAEAADIAGRMIRTVRKISAGTICVVEGGPIVRPEEMDEVCQAAHADGYIGGSTIDRVPLETAIELVTAAFKTMGALRRRVTRLERRLDPRRMPVCVVGGTQSVIRARAGYEQALATDLPVLIIGEPGSGRRDLARAVHAGGRRRARRLTWLTCAAGQDRTDADLESSPDNQYMKAGQYGYDPALPPVRFDPAQAKKLVAEAGYPNGFRLEIDCQNDRFVNDAAICQAIAQMLTRIGIATTPEVMPHAVWVPRANKHEFSLFTYFWTIDTPEPSIMLISQLATPDPSRGRGAFNRGIYSNPEFDAALDKALITLDRDARESLLIKATDLAFRDYAVAPLHHQFNIEAMVKTIHHTPRIDGYIRAVDLTPQEGP
jgi:hypothetical protein